MCKRLGVGIFGREDGAYNGPRDAYIGIVPQYSRLTVRVIKRCAFVLNFGEIRKNAEATGKAGWRPHLFFVFGGADDTEPFAEGRRAFANVDGDEKRRTECHAHQFAHRGSPLKVKPSKDVLGGSRVVVLNEVCRETKRGELISAECFHEEAAIVFIHFGHNDGSAIQVFGLNAELHKPYYSRKRVATLKLRQCDINLEAETRLSNQCVESCDRLSV